MPFCDIIVIIVQIFCDLKGWEFETKIQNLISFGNNLKIEWEMDAWEDTIGLKSGCCLYQSISFHVV